MGRKGGINTENKEGKIKNKKGILLIFALIVGLSLMIVPKFLQKEEKESSENIGDDVTYYSEKLEEKIHDLICRSEGVGNAAVVVSLDTTEEYVLAQNQSENGDNTLSEYVIVNRNGSEETVLIKEIYPKVRGVAVVCDGGNSAKIKNRVTALISAALGIPANKIAVSG